VRETRRRRGGEEERKGEGEKGRRGEGEEGRRGEGEEKRRRGARGGEKERGRDVGGMQVGNGSPPAAFDKVKGKQGGRLPPTLGTSTSLPQCLLTSLGTYTYLISFPFSRLRRMSMYQFNVSVQCVSPMCQCDHHDRCYGTYGVLYTSYSYLYGGYAYIYGET
jgi:hypothetical protein